VLAQRGLVQRVLALRQLCLNHYPAKTNGSCLLTSPGIEENVSTDEDCYKWQWSTLELTGEGDLEKSSREVMDAIRTMQ